MPIQGNVTFLYGQADGSFEHVLEGIHEIYKLIDDGLPHIPSDLRPKMRNALLENLFAKMEELVKLCEEVDGNMAIIRLNEKVQ